jgi:hypothetical protein
LASLLAALIARALGALLLATPRRLNYYAEAERIIHGSVRGAVHQHLLHSGYIEERTVDTRGALVVVTAAGRKELRNRS